MDEPRYGFVPINNDGSELERGQGLALGGRMHPIETSTIETAIHFMY